MSYSKHFKAQCEAKMKLIGILELVEDQVLPSYKNLSFDSEPQVTEERLSIVFRAGVPSAEHSDNPYAREQINRLYDVVEDLKVRLDAAYNIDAVGAQVHNGCCTMLVTLRERK